MAEIVQRHLESMINELEEMKRIKLFSNEETKEIIKKRKQFEYKVNGPSKNLKDFKSYIEYELALIMFIRNRRDKYKIGEKKRVIEYRILARIKRLYDISLTRYPNEFTLRLAYFKFCKDYNFINAASKSVEDMLKHFSQDPDVWIIGSTWFAQEQSDFKRGLDILHRGLSLHKNNHNLYKKAMELELSKMENEKNDMTDKELKRIIDKINKYVNAILKSISNYNFIIDILNLLQEHESTIEIQKVIIEQLLDDHSDRAIVWHTLAQREWHDLHYVTDDVSTSKNYDDSFENAINKYREGLLKVQENEKTMLWQYYIRFLFDLNNNNSTSNVDSLLKKTLKEASAESALTEEMYIKWLELGSGEESFDIIKEGVKMLPKSQNLWKFNLELSLISNNEELSREIFYDAIENLKEDALPVWLLYIDACKTAGDIDNLYQKGIKEPAQVSNILKTNYLQWLVKTKSIDDVRKTYQSLVNLKPFYKELHTVMLEIEIEQSILNVQSCVNIFKTMCSQLGKQDVNVWINYIIFHMKYDTSNYLNDIVQRIVREAESTLLEPCLVDFKEKYSDVLSGEISSFM